MNNVHVIVGAGGLGRALATELAGRGLDTRLVSRSAGAELPGVGLIRADARDPEALAGALRGAGVVYQCAQPAYTRWAQEFPQLQRGILDAAVRAQADLVITDNLYAYGDPSGLPITEDSPERATTKKGAVRRSMAHEALEAHREGRLRVALSRPADYFGPGHLQASGPVFGAAAQGKAMRFIGSMDQPHSFSYVPDAARAMATLGTSSSGWGRAWIPPVQPAMTQGEFARRIWAAAGRSGEPKVTLLGRGAVTMLSPIVPIVRELREMLYGFEKPFIVDSSHFESAFGEKPTPTDEAIDSTIQSFL